jgi:hypothetical protein
MTEANAEIEATVRGLLGASGLALSEEQIAGFVRIYPTLRQQADRLYAIPELRYEEPALTFRASFEPE